MSRPRPAIGISKVDPDTLTVSHIQIKGDRATANVTPTVADEDPARRFVREGGAWKIDVDPA